LFIKKKIMVAIFTSIICSNGGTYVFKDLKIINYLSKHGKYRTNLNPS
jgi:hypothetical protein